MSGLRQLSVYTPDACFSPIIGGSLSRPVERYPSIFGDSELLKKYPYFLACAIPATFSALACFVTLFFLKEVRQSLAYSLPSTVPDPRTFVSS